MHCHRREVHDLHVATVHGGRSHCMSGPGSTWKLQAWRARLGWKLTGGCWRRGWKVEGGMEVALGLRDAAAQLHTPLWCTWPSRRSSPSPPRPPRCSASTYQVMARSSYVPALSSRRRRRVAGSSLSGGRRRVIVALSSPDRHRAPAPPSPLLVAPSPTRKSSGAPGLERGRGGHLVE